MPKPVSNRLLLALPTLLPLVNLTIERIRNHEGTLERNIPARLKFSDSGARWVRSGERDLCHEVVALETLLGFQPIWPATKIWRPVAATPLAKPLAGFKCLGRAERQLLRLFGVVPLQSVRKFASFSLRCPPTKIHLPSRPSLGWRNCMRVSVRGLG